MTPNFQKGRNISSVIETNDIPEDFNISFEANDLYFDSEIGDKFKDRTYKIAPFNKESIN